MHESAESAIRPAEQFLAQLRATADDRAAANAVLEARCGIVDFFPDTASYVHFSSESLGEIQPGSRRAYGDVQTPPDLALRVCKALARQGIRPEVLLEPTCGRGHFLLAAIQVFPDLQWMGGVEIYPAHLWEAKYRLLAYFLAHPDAHRPTIHLYCADVFSFDWNHLAAKGKDRSWLILGNPPWVTAAELGVLGSNNLPDKRNTDQLKGLDAMTGKGNFDIAEAIISRMLETFSAHSGHLALLVKTAVVRKLVRSQRHRKWPIGEMKAYRLDARREFGVSADAALFCCTLGQAPGQQCEDRTFAAPKVSGRRFGWEGEAFVADCRAYRAVVRYAGQSQVSWRSGLKHDCAAVFELRVAGAAWTNKAGESVILERERVFPLLKSSQLTGGLFTHTDRGVVVPQYKIGEATAPLESECPLTWAYLHRHLARLQARKSRIYRQAPPFAVFGVGAYTFAPYKVMVSGLYKQARFSLVFPVEGRPVIPDDTCYFLPFDRPDFAAFAWWLLRQEPCSDLLRALVFPDAKRPYTKEVLGQIDLGKLAGGLSQGEVDRMRAELGEIPELQFTASAWEAFLAVFVSDK